MVEKKLIELDGRTLEGGGQLLRLSVCLAALTSTPVKITHIRGNRSGGGGLKAQHLASVKWLAHACNATVSGAEKGSTTLTFTPGKIPEYQNSPAYTKRRAESGRQIWEARLDIGTAGSTGLALQAILPFILFSPPRDDQRKVSELPVRLTLTGGTNVSGSPSYEYISQVLLPTLAHIGLPEISSDLSKRGWSHGGGSSIGSFTLLIPARKSVVLPAFTLCPENTDAPPVEPSEITATLIAPISLHEPFRTALEGALTSLLSASPTLTINCETSDYDKHISLLLTATIPSSSHPYILAASLLPTSSKKTPKNPTATADLLAKQISSSLHKEWASGARADEHLRDQMVVFQALAEGGSRVWGGLDEDEDEDEDGKRERKPSLHARTAEWVVKQMLGVRVGGDGVIEGMRFGRTEERDMRDELVKEVERLVMA